MKRLNEVISVSVKEQVFTSEQLERVRELREMYSCSSELYEEFTKALGMFKDVNLLADTTQSPTLAEVDKAYGNEYTNPSEDFVFCIVDMVAEALDKKVLDKSGIDKNRVYHKNTSKLINSVMINETLLDLIFFCRMCCSGEIGCFNSFRISPTDIRRALTEYHTVKNNAWSNSQQNERVAESHKESINFGERFANDEGLTPGQYSHKLQLIAACEAVCNANKSMMDYIKATEAECKEAISWSLNNGNFKKLGVDFKTYNL